MSVVQNLKYQAPCRALLMSVVPNLRNQAVCSRLRCQGWPGWHPLQQGCGMMASDVHAPVTLVSALAQQSCNAIAGGCGL